MSAEYESRGYAISLETAAPRAEGRAGGRRLKRGPAHTRRLKPAAPSSLQSAAPGALAWGPPIPGGPGFRRTRVWPSAARAKSGWAIAFGLPGGGDPVVQLTDTIRGPPPQPPGMDTPVLPTYVCYAVGVAAFAAVPTLSQPLQHSSRAGTAATGAVVPAHGVTPPVKTARWSCVEVGGTRLTTNLRGRPLNYEVQNNPTWKRQNIKSSTITTN